MAITKSSFGITSDGEEAFLYRLENTSGAYVTITSFGCRIVSICVPDREGELRDVCLGYDTLAEYEKDTASFGAVVGRHANRIEKGVFILNDKTYHLAVNNGPNHLHGGIRGFHYYNWESAQSGNSVRFTRVSPDGEEGYPGTLTMSVTYSWSEDNELSISYEASSDQDTVFNTTNHSYFNLKGEGSGDVLDQEVCIHAKYFTPVKDSQSIPTGEYAPVAGTPMDFNVAKPIGRDIEADFEQLKFTGGYDHNYVTDNYAKGNVRSIASAYCKESGIGMEVSSDCPCVQFYAGNFVKDEKGKNDHVYHERYGFCLETQVEPNAVNVDDFHSPILRPGEEYSSETVYRFWVK